jgi:hypothetical protein
MLAWPGSPNISLLAVLYTLPNEATPTHLLSATVEIDPSTGNPNAVITAKRDQNRGGFTLMQTFTVVDFMLPDNAQIEWSNP